MQPDEGSVRANVAFATTLSADSDGVDDRYGTRNCLPCIDVSGDTASFKLFLGFSQYFNNELMVLDLMNK